MEKTKIEDLANEIFYEIFEYLNYFQSYEIFTNLKQRFRNFFANSTSPIKLNLRSVSRSIFTFYYRNIIVPNPHRIQSLHLSNPFLLDSFFSPVSIIPKFVNLQALIIDDISSKYLENLLNDLSILSNLRSLLMICNSTVPNRSFFYQKIFRLSSLKYCKISILKLDRYEYLPTLTNQFNSMTHLIIDDDFVLDDFSALLSYFPQLHHLSIHKLSTILKESSICSTIPNQLTHVYLNLIYGYFYQFEPLIRYVFHYLQV